MNWLFLVLLFLEDTPRQYPIKIERVKDADTFVVDIDLGLGVVLDDQELRAKGFDAWEVTSRRQTVEVTEAEKIKGKEAAKQVKELLEKSNGKIVAQIDNKRGAYGRFEGYVIIDGVRLDEWAKQHGFDRTVGDVLNKK